MICLTGKGLNIYNTFWSHFLRFLKTSFIIMRYRFPFEAFFYLNPNTAFLSVGFLTSHRILSSIVYICWCNRRGIRLTRCCICSCLPGLRTLFSQCLACFLCSLFVAYIEPFSIVSLFKEASRWIGIANSLNNFSRNIRLSNFWGG